MVKGLIEGLKRLWCYAFHPWVSYEQVNVVYADDVDPEPVTTQVRYCKKCGRR